MPESHLQEESTPRPDPTRLTTDLMRREIDNLRDRVLLEIKLVSDGVAHEKELTAEKFRGVDVKFEEGDKRVSEVSKVANLAVDKAFEAAKERSGRSEEGFNKALDLVGNRVDDLKERQDRGEGKSTGIGASWVILLNVAGLIAILITIYVTLRR